MDIKYLIRIGIYISISVVLNLLDRTISVTFLFRIGLSNIIPLIFLMKGKYMDSLIILSGRILVANLLFGTFFTHVYLMTLTSNLAAFMAMILFHRIYMVKKTYSITGISVIGSVINNILQLLVIKYIFFSPFSVSNLIPAAIGIGVIAGVIIAMIAQFTMRKMMNTI